MRNTIPCHVSAQELITGIRTPIPRRARPCGSTKTACPTGCKPSTRLFTPLPESVAQQCHRRQRVKVQSTVQVAGFHETTDSAPRLQDIDIESIINRQGLVDPEVPGGVEASVFAVYDARKKLQYVGFSKDLRNSLRTVLSRRPDKAFFFKATHLDSLDQEKMLAIRDLWFEECGGAPPGNHLVMERTAWQQPVDSGAISQRGKKGAAEEKAAQLLKAIKDRGCKEEFVPNPTLLLDGQVDFLPAAALDEAQIAARRAAAEEAARITRIGKAIVDGQDKTFSVHYDMKLPTNNGFMMDVSVVYDNQETQHRIIIGKEYYEPEHVEPEHVIEAALSLLMEKKVPRHTEGLLLSSQFPSNYFSISEVEQWFGDDFNEVFERCTGEPLQDGAKFWRFNRVHTYGPAMLDEQSSVGVYE